MRNVRYSMRAIRRAPGFSSVVVLTLALGIGMATAMFSVVNGLLLEPLPYPQSDRLVLLWQGRSGQAIDKDWFSIAQFVDIRDGTTSFEELSLGIGVGATLTGRGEPQEVGVLHTSSPYLDMIGARPALGRIFNDADDQGGAQKVALLSYDLWQTAYASDPGVVGQTVTLNGTALEIVGVLAREVLIDNEVLPTLGAVDPLAVILSLPLSEQQLQQRNGEDFNLMGRLKPGVSVQQAQAELDLVAARIQDLHESDPGSGFFIRAVPLLDEVVGDVRQQLWLLLGAVGVLLAIACGNVANLLLSRASSRNRELGIRAAVGANRKELVGQLLTEGATLAALGGVLGIVFAMGAVAALRSIGAASLPRLSAIQVDSSVLGFALGISAVSCLLFALVPALKASSVDLTRLLNTGGRSGTGHASLWSRFNLSSGLIVAEIALSLILLIGGGLLGRSMLALRDVSPGFDAENRLSFRIQLAGPNYPAAARRTFIPDLIRSLEEIPGIERAAGISMVPFGGNLGWVPVTVPGYVPPDGGSGEFQADFRRITPGFFDVMSIPLVAGAAFDDSHTEDTPIVALIDERLATQYFAGRDPVGAYMTVLGMDSVRVIGVVGAVKHTSLEEAERPTVYVTHAHFPGSATVMVMRTRAEPTTLVAPATAAVHAMDPNLAVVDIASMEGRIENSLAERRFAMLLMQTFSAAAVVLAAIGIYGLIAYRVSLSVPEIGMRMALGAQRGTIMGLILSRGMILCAIGAGIGIVGAVGATRLMQTLLFGVGNTDIPTYAAMLVGLAVVVFAACLVPALRATRIDPLEALREG